MLGLEYGIKIAKKLEKENGYIYLNQFNNINNPLAHQTTSQEIIQDFKKLDYLVCGIGSACTICGLSKSLKEVYSNIKIIGVLPKESTSKINGIGANIKSSFIDDKLIDDIIIVDGDEVKKEYVKLANKGLLVGLSSVACFIASKICLLMQVVANFLKVSSPIVPLDSSKCFAASNKPIIPS